MTRYVPSHFISMSYDADKSLILHSSATGALGVVPAEQAEEAREMLLPGRSYDDPQGDLAISLIKGGMLVPANRNEQWESHKEYVGRYRDDNLHLIVLPTEDCNFRCIYCYESFLRGTMPQEIQDGIVELVRSKQRLKHLEVSCFGGEPLLASEVVISVMQRLNDYCEASGVKLLSSATTNAYLLTPELAPVIIGLGVKHFQITLDGLDHDHDKRRVGRNGEATFDTILANLRALRDSELEFNVVIRHNFDPDSLQRLEPFLDMLAGEFAADERFRYNFQRIGRWGGENDEALEVCEGRDGARAADNARWLALGKGLRDAHTTNLIQPNGSVCYAANPNSFVVGSDGQLYKCTVELDYHDRNIVGRLHPDGTMDLNWQRMALWTETDGMDSGKKCSTCWFSPSCHGATCPKNWMDDNDCECPAVKKTIQQTLTFIRADAITFGPPADAATAKCGK